MPNADCVYCATAGTPKYGFRALCPECGRGYLSPFPTDPNPEQAGYPLGVPVTPISAPQPAPTETPPRPSHYRPGHTCPACGGSEVAHSGNLYHEAPGSPLLDPPPEILRCCACRLAFRADGQPYDEIGRRALWIDPPAPAPAPIAPASRKTRKAAGSTQGSLF